MHAKISRSCTTDLKRSLLSLLSTSRELYQANKNLFGFLPLTILLLKGMSRGVSLVTVQFK